MNKPWFTQLKTNNYLFRLLTGMLVCVGVMVAVFTLLFYVFVTDRINRASQNYLTEIADFVLNEKLFYILVDDPQAIEGQLESLRYIPWLSYAEIDKASSEKKYATGQSEWLADISSDTPVFNNSATQFHLKTPIFYTESDQDNTPSHAVTEKIGYLHIAVTKQPIKNLTQVVAWITLIACLAGLGMALPVLIFWSRKLSRPVTVLSEQLERVDLRQNVQTIVSVDDPPQEMERIIDVVNQMIRRIASHYETLEIEIDRRTQDLFQALQDTKRIQSEKSTLIANLSHDLRTPLTGVIGYIDLCREALAHTDDPTTQDNLNKAYRSAVRLSEEITLLLQYSMAGRASTEIEMAAFDMTHLINACIESTTPSGLMSNNHVYSTHQGEHLVCTDQVRLKHIIENLLTNAHKYCHDGEVHIHTTITDAIDITVTDTGIGIAPEQLDRIFDINYRAGNLERSTDSGYGIGLSLCKQWVDYLNGEISVTSRLSKGSTFRVSVKNEVEQLLKVAGSS